MAADDLTMRKKQSITSTDILVNESYKIVKL